VTRWGWLILGLFLSPGCVVVDVGVTNPVAGLSRVAVVPFFNLSAEPSADGHRFAEAYFAELQKVPGFQVLPVGVAEAAIQDLQLDLQNPEDAMKLGQVLGVDAVVVGAITDYNPYYPPRVGLQVSWYSPHPWAFSPGVPTEPFARKAILESGYCPEDECEPAEGRWDRFKRWFKRRSGKAYAEHSTLFRGQSEAVFPPRPPEDSGVPAPPEPLPPRALIHPETPPEVPPPGVVEGPPIAPPPGVVLTPTPIEPLMSYTRLFDGASAELTATFRDYLELRDDLRSGGWKASLYRTEDFIRFSSHRMIVEMLALHGGETRHRVVFLWRREK
jgi:hypothetical protein